MTFDNNAELSFSSEDGPTGRERIHKKNRISKSFIVFGKIIFCCFPRIISTIYTSATVFLSMIFPFSPSFFHCFPQIPSLSAQLWHRNKPAENICKAVKSPSITVIRSPAIGSKVILQLLFCVSATSQFAMQTNISEKCEIKSKCVKVCVLVADVVWLRSFIAVHFQYFDIATIVRWQFCSVTNTKPLLQFYNNSKAPNSCKMFCNVFVF